MHSFELAAAGHLFKKEIKASGKSVSNPEMEAAGCTVSHISQFALHLLTNNAVTEALLDIDSKKATGDNLDPFLLQLSALMISEYITHIFNLTFLSDIIPKV